MYVASATSKWRGRSRLWALLCGALLVGLVSAGLWSLAGPAPDAAAQDDEPTARVCVTKQVDTNAFERGYVASDFEVRIDLESGGSSVDSTTESFVVPTDQPVGDPCPADIAVDGSQGYVLFSAPLTTEIEGVRVTEVDAPRDVEFVVTCGDSSAEPDSALFVPTQTEDINLLCTISNETAPNTTLCITKELGPVAMSQGLSAEASFEVSYELETSEGSIVTRSEAAADGCDEAEGALSAAFTVRPGASVEVTELSDSIEGMELVGAECENEPASSEGNTFTVDIPAPHLEGDPAPVACTVTNESTATPVCIAKVLTQNAVDAMVAAGTGDATSFSFTAEAIFDIAPLVAVDDAPLATAVPDVCVDDGPNCNGRFSPQCVPPFVSTPDDFASIAFDVHFVQADGSDAIVITETAPAGSPVAVRSAQCFQDVDDTHTFRSAEVSGNTVRINQTEGSTGPLRCTITNDSTRVCVAKYVTPDARDAGFAPNDFSFTYKSGEMPPFTGEAKAVAPIPAPPADGPPAGPSQACIEDTCHAQNDTCSTNVPNDDPFFPPEAYGYTEFFMTPGKAFEITEIIPADAPIASINPICMDPDRKRLSQNGSTVISNTVTGEARGSIVLCFFTNDAERVCVSKFVGMAAAMGGFSADQFSFQIDDGPFVPVSSDSFSEDCGPMCIENEWNELRSSYDEGPCPPRCEDIICPVAITTQDNGDHANGDHDHGGSEGYAELFVRPGAEFTITEQGPDGPIGAVFSVCTSRNGPPEWEIESKNLEYGNGERDDFSSADGYADPYVEFGYGPYPSDEPTHCMFENDSIVVCVTKHVGPTATHFGIAPGDFTFALTLSEQPILQQYASAAVFPGGDDAQVSDEVPWGCERDQCDGWPIDDLRSEQNGIEVFPCDPCDIPESQCLQANVGPVNGYAHGVGFTSFLVAPYEYFTVTETVPDGMPAGPTEPPFCNQQIRRVQQYGTDFTSASGYSFPEGGAVYCDFFNDSVVVCVAKFVGDTASTQFSPADFTFTIDVAPIPVQDDVIVGFANVVPANGDTQIQPEVPWGCEPPCEYQNGELGTIDPCGPCNGEFVVNCASLSPIENANVGFTSFPVAPFSEITVTEIVPPSIAAHVGPVSSRCRSVFGGPPTRALAGEGIQDDDATEDPYETPGEASAQAFPYSGPVLCDFQNDSVRVCVSKQVGPNAADAGFVPADFEFSLELTDSGNDIVGQDNVLPAGEAGLTPAPSEACLTKDDCDTNVGDDFVVGCDVATPDEGSLFGFTELLVAPNAQFTVSETIPTGGTDAFPDAQIGAVASSCTSDRPQTLSAEAEASGSEDFTTASGFAEYDPYFPVPVSCDFVNDSVRIDIDKEVINDNGGEATADQFAFDVFDDAGAALSQSTTVAFVAPGQTVIVAEQQFEAYQQVSGECSVVASDDDPIAAGDDGAVTIDLPDYGEQVECSFVNTDPAAIVCAVQILDAGSSGFTLADLGMELYSNGELVAAVNSDDAGSDECAGGDAGTDDGTMTGASILLAEVLADGRPFTFVQRFPSDVGVRLQSVSLSCQRSLGATQAMPSADPAVFTPTPGSVTRCVAEVVAVPVALTVTKTVVGGTAEPSDFTLTVTNVTDPDNPVVVASGPGPVLDVADLPAGTYQVGESEAPGYTPVNSCEAAVVVDNNTAGPIECEIENRARPLRGLLPSAPFAEPTEEPIAPDVTQAAANAATTAATTAVATSDLAITGASTNTTMMFGVALMGVGATLAGTVRRRRQRC